MEANLKQSVAVFVFRQRIFNSSTKLRNNFLFQISYWNLSTLSFRWPFSLMKIYNTKTIDTLVCML